MTKLFSQNAKMKKSANSNTVVYNFGIPAYKSKSGLITCPNADKCISGCYARSGAYQWDNVNKAYEYRLLCTQEKEFCYDACQALIKLEKKHLGKELCIRVHDSGDFYSEEYLLKWLEIAHAMPSIKFYAYTKMVGLIKSIDGSGMYLNKIPANFTFIFSYGGKQDHLINPKTDRHSYVFDSEEKLVRSGYYDATEDDLRAAFGPWHRIGLVYHGAKRFDNTQWGKVLH